MKKCLIALAAAVLLIANGYDAPVMLSVPSCGIEVACEFVANGHHIQRVVDKAETAAWYPPYILDHASENFSGLWEIAVGDSAVFGNCRYRCTFVTTGRSDRGIYAPGGVPEADMYLCTCVPNGQPYEIVIVGLEKEKAA